MSQRSPKFFLRERIISQIVNEKSLKKTWSKKTHTDFRAFPLVDPLHYLDVNLSIKDICRKIVTQIRAGEYSVSRVKRYLVEKSRGLCRQMTIPSVEDALTLQCLADAFWQDIKAEAPSKNAFFEPKDHSFTKNDDDEPQYGSIKSWLDFQKTILGFSRENKYIVVTDIANYYDFIDFSHLRNVIVSTVKIKEPVVDFLMFMLSGMCWRPDYMPTREVGMPQMDIDAPRLLAHCFLFELDMVVEDLSFANYARFMDDIDAGVDTIADAKNIIKSIDLTLQTRQLRLNSGKTKILSHQDARKHFKILENRFLKWLERSFAPGREARAAQHLGVVLRRWYRRKVFDEGNGEKILKRMFTLAIKFAAHLDRSIVAETIRLRPNLRSSALRYLAHVGFGAEDVRQMRKMIEDGYVCDDAFFLEVGRHLVVARVGVDKRIIGEIEKLIDCIAKPEFYRIYTAILLSSRFMPFDKTFSLVERYSNQWRHDFHLGRLVAGLAPLARRANLYPPFSQAVMSSSNAEALAVLNFHARVRNEPIPNTVLNKFLKRDSSFPCGVRFGKWVMLHGVLANGSVPEKKKQKIRKEFAHLATEPYFDVPGLKA